MALFRHQTAETESGTGAGPVTSLDQLPPPSAPSGRPTSTPAAASAPQGVDSAASPDPAPAEAPTVREDPPLVVPKTRTSAAYSGVAVGLVVLVLVIIFIAQNLNDARVHFLGLNFQLPIGLLILASVVAGGIIVLLVSAARVAQLRLMARRHKAGRPTR